MKCFQICTIRWNDKTGEKMNEFVIADSMQQVVDYLKIDLQDEAIEIETVTTVCPITKNLCLSHGEDSTTVKTSNQNTFSGEDG